MAKFNDYSRFFKEVYNIEFEFLGKVFKVKNSQRNSMKLIEANKKIQGINLLEKQLNGKNSTEEEEAELVYQQMQVYDILEEAIEKVLGSDQFKTIKAMDFGTNGYMILFRILMGLVSGTPHEKIMEELIKEQEEANEGEQEENQEN